MDVAELPRARFSWLLEWYKAGGPPDAIRSTAQQQPAPAPSKPELVFDDPLVEDVAQWVYAKPGYKGKGLYDIKLAMWCALNGKPHAASWQCRRAACRVPSGALTKGKDRIMSIKVFTTKTAGEDRIAVKSPYYPPFTDEARRLNGKWNAGQWEFDLRDEERVRAALRKCYGRDGTPGQLFETTTVTVKITHSTPNPYFAYGREIANRRDRDSYPKLGEGVVVIGGDFEKQRRITQQSKTNQPRGSIARSA